MFFGYVIIKDNYDMYMLRSYATEHWQCAGGEEKNRHDILLLCSSKTSAITAVVLIRSRILSLYSDIRTYCSYCLCTQTSALNTAVLRRPRLDVGTQEHVAAHGNALST